MNRLQNKVALIVGAGQMPGTTPGNGRAVAARFAQEGAKVFAVDREFGRAEQTARAIRDAGGVCIPFAADICDERDIKSAADACISAFGQIDILHNNVGVAAGGGDLPLDSITESAFDTIVAINLRGMVMTCKQVLPHMQARRCGVIINVSSAAALSRHRTIGYKTSKAGVVALTQYIANEYARFGVRANCILPGMIDTPMAIEPRAGGDDDARHAVRAARDALVPLRGKMGTAEDIANAALFLASDEASFITGVNLPVDGGHLSFVGVPT